ncbi:hypothetical protein [Stenotrophomonas sp. NPDC077659]|uniref:hypothetical protein n=1 Tax=Stenotrophomonas sp. NPDC077659 TaxID=3390694 RepID=UPI003D067C02
MGQITMKFPPPDNWQDFEKLTRALCADEWSDPQAQILGRQGQAQHGVDVVGWDYRNRRRLRVGVQCKRRSIADAEGNVSVIGVVTMCDVVDSLAMTEPLSIPLDSFVLATTAQQDARLQEQLASLSLARKNEGKCEVSIWFWEWFEEKLNRNLLVGLQFYQEVLERYGLARGDRLVAAKLRAGFNRPLMKTKMENENQIGSIIEAVTLLQHLIATGYLRDGDSNLVDSCLPARRMTAPVDRRSVDIIEAKLQRLRDDVTECSARGDIRPGGGDWIVFQDPAIAPRLNVLRADILLELNQLLKRHEVDPVESALLHL